MELWKHHDCVTEFSFRFTATLFIHSYKYSFIHECSYWTYGPSSASFTFRALNLWLQHPLANVVSSGGNTAWSMATFSFFYLFFSFTLMCLCVVFIYCYCYFTAHAHAASSLSGWAELPTLPCSSWAGGCFPHFWTNSLTISSDTAPFSLPLPPSGALIVHFLSKNKYPYFFLCFGLHIFF